MKLSKLLLCFTLFVSLFSKPLSAQSDKLVKEAEQTMLRATKYMVEEVSTNGGYVWYYLPDLSRRWGEMEAYKTMVWTQGAGWAMSSWTLTVPQAMNTTTRPQKKQLLL